jgi:hypothetical protein
MSYEPRLIAPFDGGGLQLYYKPWLIGKEAFPRLEDAYAWRGTVQKRQGYNLLGTLPTSPVQGLRTYIVPVTGDELLIAFSTTKSYLWSTVGSTFTDITFTPAAAPFSWTGGVDDFFWSANYANAIWVSNNVDPIRFYNGSTTAGWSTHTPIVNGATTLQKALLIIPYRGRLVVLNTQEGGIGFKQRARWSQIGTPYLPTVAGTYVPPAPYAVPGAGDAFAWRDDIPGRGGYIDADTNEQIVSAGIIQNTLIVFFQRSTWRLRYTGNEVLPFVWERINTQLGAESTFSAIPFDDALLGFSRFGYVGANTNSVARIDEKIPDLSFFTETGSTLEGLKRIHGIRDYYRQMAYWTFAASDTNANSPNRVLTYNYIDQTWAIFNQSFRCFGTYKTTDDTTWASLPVPWDSMNEPWSSSFAQDNFPQVVAGATNGNVYTCYELLQASSDNGTNFGFIIQTKRFNPYIDKGQRCRLAYVDIYTTGTNGGQITVQHFVNDRNDTPDIIRTVNISTSETAKYTRVFIGSSGRFHNLVLTLTPAQIADPVIGQTQFELQGLVIWTKPDGRVKQ